MNSKYTDPTAIIQLIGCTFKDPSILDNTDMYHITENDFVEEFHKVVFGSINNLHLSGSTKIDVKTIADFLEVRPKAKAIFEQGKGEEYLIRAAEVAVPETFNYMNNRPPLSKIIFYINI